MLEELNHHPAIRNIAVATDFSPWSDRAMQHALAIARWYDAALHILHTVRQAEFSWVPDLMVRLDELAERDCEDMKRRLSAVYNLDGIDHRSWMLFGEFSTIEDFVRDRTIDLLVLGTRGRSGISKLLLGSATDQIFHSVSCPVLTVGPSSRAAASRPLLNKVLFATDLSPQSTVALPYALEGAEAWNAAVDILHISSPERTDGQNKMEAYRRQLDVFAVTHPKVSIRFHTLPGEPSSAVLEFARQNKEDLIVLGLDVRRSLYAGPAMSHAYEIVRQARCPVLSVRCASSRTVHQ